MKKDNLTKKELWMLSYLSFHYDFVSPTEIGRTYGFNVLGKAKCHSSTASPTLLKLTRLGLLERNDKGHYKLKRKHKVKLK